MSQKSPSRKRSNRLPWIEVPGLFKDSVVEFFQKDGLFHGAALAYYALFAIVPLFYLCISFIGRFIGQELILEIIGSFLQNKIGIQDVSGIMDFMSEFDFDQGNFFMELVSVAVLLVASTAFIVSLKHSINVFFGLEIKFSSTRRQMWSTVIFRLLSVLYVGIIALVIIVLYFAQTILMGISSSLFEENEFFSKYVAIIVQHGFALLSNVVIFTIVFKYVHDGFVQWKLAIGGAVVTTIFLYLGQLLIKYYLFHIFFMSSGGFAGSLFIILAWVYYTSQIIFFGANFSSVYARKVGRPIKFQGESRFYKQVRAKV